MIRYGVRGFGYTRSARCFANYDNIFRSNFRRVSDLQFRSELIFRYIVLGFITYKSAGGERVYYPGKGSDRGLAVEGIEGFARTAVLLAAWVAGGRDSVIILEPFTQLQVDIIGLLRSGILAGTDPSSPFYWGDMGDCRGDDQRVVEAADIAITIWLTRETLWQTLSNEERGQIIAWLARAARARVHPNNWYLFKITICLVVRFLGGSFQDAEGVLHLYAAIKEKHLECGWFFDPPHGVDYYSAWCYAYHLFWIDQIDPNFDPDFIRAKLIGSGALTAHLISPDGIPIMGRSVCYRMAIPVPVLASSWYLGTDDTVGLARRSLEVIIDYFVSRGALQGGCVTQGYYGANMDLLDRYSGRGSAQWSLRSLVMAFYNDREAPFWSKKTGLLPVERGSYELDLSRLGWHVSADSQTRKITVTIPSNKTSTASVTRFNVGHRIGEFVLRRPCQPWNFGSKYKRFRYYSDVPFYDLPD